LCLGTHPDFLHLDNFLSKPPKHVASVDRCSSCSSKVEILRLLSMPSIPAHQNCQRWDGIS
jgi:hypothetical protein